jgi:hypothetical protein
MDYVERTETDVHLKQTRNFSEDGENVSFLHTHYKHMNIPVSKDCIFMTLNFKLNPLLNVHSSKSN